MIDKTQLRKLIRTVLKEYDPYIPYSKDAENLLMMTAAHESRLGTYIRQVKGPALGIYQMEPATHNDIWANYLEYEEDLSQWMFDDEMCPMGFNHLGLEHSLWYSTVMARVHYYRVPTKLPTREEFPSQNAYLMGLARYAKEYYNTPKGKATVEDYFEAYVQHCQE